MNLELLETKLRSVGVLGYRLTRYGGLIAQNMWDDDCRRNIYSASKCFTACAVGFAAEEGLLSLDEKLTEAFAEEMPLNVDDNLKKATVRDLLTMCMGQENSNVLLGASRPRYQRKDWIRMIFEQPFEYEPGTKFVYSNVGPYLAGVLVQRRAGCDLVQYLMPRLFEPLGIILPTWEVDPNGCTFGAGGLMLTLEELHRFGMFCLQKGMYNGVQLLSREWMEACTKPQDHAEYGYLFWIGKYGSFRADGKYGQITVVFEDKDAVFSVMSECKDYPELFRIIYDLYFAL